MGRQLTLIQRRDLKKTGAAPAAVAHTTAPNADAAALPAVTAVIAGPGENDALEQVDTREWARDDEQERAERGERAEDRAREVERLRGREVGRGCGRA